MIDQHSAVAVLRPLDIVLDVDECEVTLDEGWSPYGQVEITCTMPPAEEREAIDLRETDLRLDLTLRRDFGSRWTLADLDALGANDLDVMDTLFGGQPLAAIENSLSSPWNPAGLIAGQSIHLNLTVTERTFDDRRQKLTLRASTDEALLQGDILLAATALDPATTSLAAIVDSVLARQGATLSADSEDATVAEVAATLWQPGVAAWRYLDSMLEAASLRLWCDIDRNWRISTRQASVPGSVSLSPTTMTEHRDTMTLDAEVWCDAVLVHYRYVDAFGLTVDEYDYDGEVPSRAGLVIERTTVYPGPGAAAGILSRRQARGRVLEITADSVYTARPGMAATVNPPDTVSLSGYVAAVTWSLPAGEMSVETRGLVDTPPTAWVFAPAGVSWADVPVGMSWNEYDPEDL